MSVSVTNSGGTILINDSDSVYYIEKQKVDVSTKGNNVIIRWDKTHYVSYPYTDFTAPSGASAAIVAAAIAAFLSTGSGAQSNSITVSYTIGVDGVADMDYNFDPNTNALIQSIEMGSSIIPANSPVTSIVVKCTSALAGSGSPTATCNVGNTSGGSEFISTISMSSLNGIISVSAQVAAGAAASSVYFSITPSGDWSTLTAGAWKIWITYSDNSNN